MLLTWRSTVRSLTTSSAAIARDLSCPRLRGRRTSSSRGDRPFVRAVGAPFAARRQGHEVGTCAQPLEYLARRLQLQLRGLLVAERAAGGSDQNASEARAGADVELLQTPGRLSQGDQRPADIAVGEARRPRACQWPIAGRTGLPNPSQISVRPAEPTSRAASRSPAATMISASAGRRAARLKGCS